MTLTLTMRLKSISRRQSWIFRAAVAWLAFAGVVAATAAAEKRLTLNAPAEDRAVQVVRIPLAAGTGPALVLESAAGETVPAQRDADGLTFMVGSQRAGQILEFMLRERPVPVAEANEASGVHVKREAGHLAVEVFGRPLLSYVSDKTTLPRPDIPAKFMRAGYLHPLWSPAGEQVTDDYPTNHVHHHGIWSPWTKTRFQDRTPDFWNMGDQTGTVEHEAVEHTWSGPVHGGFVARHRFVDLSAKPDPITVLHETWTVTAYALPAAKMRMHVFDLAISQTCATSDPLILPEYHYGGLGLRGRGNWNGVDACSLLTASGETDRVRAHTRRERWISVYGPADGGTVSVTMMDHPDNFRAPQPLRVHPHEPFFCYAPPQLGEFGIVPGQPYAVRYRLVVADGPPDASTLDAIWRGFAQPATVEIPQLR